MKKSTDAKKNRIPVATGVVCICAMFILCALIAASIFGSVSEELYAERCNSLNEVSEQIAKTIHTTCNSAWNIADAAFSHILSSEIERKEDLAALLSEAESGAYAYQYHLMVIDSHTNYYLANGKIGLFRNVGFLKQSANERQVVMTTVTFESNSEYMLFMRRLQEPLLLKDGTQITHTVMVLPHDVYSSAFSASGFDGSADIFIVHTDGRSIYRQDNTGDFSISANVMRTLENVRFLHGGTFSDIMDSLANPSAECREFIYDDKNYFVSLAPVGSPDWVVVLMIPTNQMNSGSEHLLNTAMYRIVAISVIGILMAVLIICYFISGANMRIRAKQQKQVNDALQMAAQEATRVNLVKSEFFSHVSHDLRTPLNGILGMLERAEECTDISEEVQYCLSGIGVASRQLNALVNDVLDITRLENGNNAPAETPFDMRTLLDTCSSIVEISAKHRHISFTYQCEAFEHPYLFGSDLYLRKILMNVLDNAIKFTNPGGSVTLEAAEIASDGQNASYRFMITDTGIGMKEGYQEHIFEPFWQERVNSYTDNEGSGLGMYITKKLVDKMQGSIEVYSKENEGSRFIIVLPFAVDHRAVSQAGENAQSLSEPLQGMTVLLAEDNKLNRDIAAHVLQKAGARVLIACDGEEAVQTFLQSDIGSIDVILMDVMMPVMDGLEATKRIRSLSRPDGKSVSIIAMTANAFEEDIKKTLGAGMNEHLSKPVRKNRLLSCLLKYKRADHTSPISDIQKR